MTKKNIKRLYRAPKEDSVIAGVCAGIGNYLEVDPVAIRLIWVIAGLISLGLGFFAYLIAWLIMPRK